MTGSGMQLAMGRFGDMGKISATRDGLLSSLCFRKHEYTAFHEHCILSAESSQVWENLLKTPGRLTIQAQFRKV